MLAAIYPHDWRLPLVRHYQESMTQMFESRLIHHRSCYSSIGRILTCVYWLAKFGLASNCLLPYAKTTCFYVYKSCVCLLYNAQTTCDYYTPHIQHYNMKRTNIYIPQELLDRLKAISQGRTIAAMVREAIIFYLKHHEEK